MRLLQNGILMFFVQLSRSLFTTTSWVGLSFQMTQEVMKRLTGGLSPISHRAVVPRFRFRLCMTSRFRKGQCLGNQRGREQTSS